MTNMKPTGTRNTLVPIVVEQTGNGERSYDIYSRLLRYFLHLYLPKRTSSSCSLTPVILSRSDLK